MRHQLSPAEQLAYSTLRLECDLADGHKTVGTAFHFEFPGRGEKFVPAIITNKHVVANSITGYLSMHTMNPDGGPRVGMAIRVRVENFEARWLMHPDHEVDLCALGPADLFEEIQAAGHEPFVISLTKSYVPSPTELRDLDAIEDIVMVGYPIGISDEVNNMPIIRRGITATHPGIDYNGKPEFMIDAACFQGSSGSPVFLYNWGSYTAKQGMLTIGHRVKLLGVLYAGPQYTAEGELEIVEVPTGRKAVALSRIPTNLGMVIKSHRILDFEPLIAEKVR